MKLEDFTFKEHNGSTYITFSEGITKTRQSGLREKRRAQIPKMFETQNERCPVKIFNFFKTKRPVNLQATGPFYLAIISNSVSNIWFKKSPMGVHTINNIMKTMISNSPLQSSNKRLTNHSARKTLVKKLKQNQLPRSEIISITGHSTEAGLDPYDSGDENQQRVISNAIDNTSGNNSRKISTFPSHIVAPNDPRILNPTFSFFNQIQHLQNLPVYSPINISQCNVQIFQHPSSATVTPNQVREEPPKKRRRLIIYSSDSSQEL